MGFWDVVGKVANAGLEKVRETGAETHQKYDRFNSYSDEQLLRKAKSSSLTDRMAAAKQLEERGYRRRD